MNPARIVHCDGSELSAEEAFHCQETSYSGGFHRPTDQLRSVKRPNYLSSPDHGLSDSSIPGLPCRVGDMILYDVEKGRIYAVYPDGSMVFAGSELKEAIRFAQTRYGTAEVKLGAACNILGIAELPKNLSDLISNRPERVMTSRGHKVHLTGNVQDFL